MTSIISSKYDGKKLESVDTSIDTPPTRGEKFVILLIKAASSKELLILS